MHYFQGSREHRPPPPPWGGGRAQKMATTSNVGSAECAQMTTYKVISLCNISKVSFHIIILH